MVDRLLINYSNFIKKQLGLLIQNDEQISERSDHLDQVQVSLNRSFKLMKLIIFEL